MRPAAMAVAGYYPLEKPFAAAISRIVPTESGTNILDPCAGQGEFLEAFPGNRLYGIELDQSRFTSLLRRLGSGDFSWSFLHGDAFRARIPERGSWGVILLNPPYHASLKWERLWLRRWLPQIVRGGAIALVIPHRAVAECVPVLVPSLSDIRVARFPTGDRFDRVLIAGTQVRDADPGDRIRVADELARLQDRHLDIPVLGTDFVRPLRTPGTGSSPGTWELLPVDEKAALGAIPWHQSTKQGPVPVPGTFGALTGLRSESGMIRPAMPLNATHTATALASGILDGAVLVPDDPTILPPIAIRAAYSRDWVESGKKTGKDGELVGVEEQQVPTLKISALDLSRGNLHELVRSADLKWDSGEYDPEDPLKGLSAGDLLVHYSRAIATTMAERIEPVFDPVRDSDYPIPGIESMARNPYQAQRERIQAILKLLNQGFVGALVAGEVATGKTTIGLQAGVSWLLSDRSDPVRRILVIAPPMIIPQWARNQIPVVIGPVDIHVLKSVSDVNRWMDDDAWNGDHEFADRLGARISIGLLPRTNAKLGPSVEGVPGACPRCGTWSSARKDVSRNRLREFRRAKGRGDRAAILAAMADDSKELAARARRRFCCESIRGTIPGQRAGVVDPLAIFLDSYSPGGIEPLKEFFSAIAAGTMPVDKSSIRFIKELARTIPDETRLDALDAVYQDLIHDSGPEAIIARELVREGLQTISYTEMSPGIRDQWVAWRVAHGDMGLEPIDSEPSPRGYFHGDSPEDAWARFVTEMRPRAFFQTIKCGEPLWTMSPKKSGYRVPLMKYIQRRFRSRIGFAISDEAHEEANPDSAQSLAGQLLHELGCPVVLLTGTTNDGYPRSMHAHLWRLSHEYRNRYKYGSTAFQEEYGYNRRIEEAIDSDNKIVAYGSSSAARVRMRPLGRPAPGFAPGAVTEFMLPVTVSISVDDLDIELPPLTVSVDEIVPDDDQLKAYTGLLGATRRQIKEDFRTKRRGQLLGALARIGSSLDRIHESTGNSSEGGYTVRYGRKHGRETVARFPGLPPSRILPKERALIDWVRGNLESGHRTLITCCYTGSDPDSFRDHPLVVRLDNLLRDAGLNGARLNVNKVPAGKRVSWIDKVVKKRVDYLIANPVAICTGLDNLTYFSRIAVFDGLMSRATVAGQLRGRVRRPADPPLTRPMEMRFFVYQNTAQALEMDLLLRKTAEARSVDGLDPRDALRAVGADGDREFAQELAEMILRG